MTDTLFLHLFEFLQGGVESSACTHGRRINVTTGSIDNQVKRDRYIEGKGEGGGGKRKTAYMKNLLNMLLGQIGR